ncbi:dihydrolipoyl dehydrogenase [Usitatibacter palustris]|uniref:Dihydrolipoyl dehydrogenase n=1 Tax=Usitatibacter palustris TaxID=2732487 RepID=A0A6M4H795_9PROT|nr:dihydrolipoyl dehydrogenase [Usitatibacter palustris]QJR14563.1 Soluble pyridine nucleotide transhydrogenase [Usitatibacter palustris]
MALLEVKVPDIGDFQDVPVIEVLVKPGDTVEKEQSLVVLESDKATMEVPSTHAGTVKEVKVKVGDKVTMGVTIVMLETAASAAASAPAATAPAPAAAPAPATSASDINVSGAELAAVLASSPSKAAEVREVLASTLASLEADYHAEVLVLGSGPGGYTAAFRSADLGKKVVLVERYSTLGGVCLNVGCIPSKALLHTAKVITDAEDAAHHGVTFGEAKIDLDGVRKFKEGVVGKLTKGLASLAKARKVTVVTGKAQFTGARTLEVETSEGKKVVSFENCIIAAGSQSARIPGFPYDDPRLLDSTTALDLKDVPKRLLIIGGGIIGLEMATVYDALGSKVTVVEFMDRLIPAADPDIVKPLARRIEKRYEKILLNTKVAKLEAVANGLRATFESAKGGEAAPAPEIYDRVLLAVGRRPNGKAIAADKAGVNVDERGWIPVDNQMRTNVPHIYAIGDIVGEPMLAHKASHEGKLAAEVIAGMTHHVWEARTIPSVAYTDPEVAWMGLQEPEAKAKGIEYEKAMIPWAASGRAIGMAREEGATKILYEKGTRRILGAAIVGINAGELIAETVLALEMGADAEDIGLTIHAHPTLSETVYFNAEMVEGTITDLMPPKR